MTFLSKFSPIFGGFVGSHLLIYSVSEFSLVLLFLFLHQLLHAISFFSFLVVSPLLFDQLFSGFLSWSSMAHLCSIFSLYIIWKPSHLACTHDSTCSYPLLVYFAGMQNSVFQALSYIHQFPSFIFTLYLFYITVSSIFLPTSLPSTGLTTRQIPANTVFRWREPC